MDIPTTENLAKRIKEALARHLDIPAETITDESLLVQDLGLDSFGMVELLFELEDATGMAIPDARLPGVRSVGDLTATLSDLLQNQDPLPISPSGRINRSAGE